MSLHESQGPSAPSSAAFGLGRWPIALAVVLALAALVLLPGLGGPGLWEPHERQLADRVAPPRSVEQLAATPAPAQPPPASDQRCLRTAPADAKARSLQSRAPTWGRDVLGDSDTGRKLPFALMGLLTVLATAGVAMRFAGARAGVIAAVALLAMPLLALQSRMLTSEIGTACGGALIVYALVALSRLRTAHGPVIAAVDAAVCVAALAVGGHLGFHGGGALLGLVVPIGAVAAAGGLGVPAVRAVVRRERVLPHIPALLATLLVTGLVAVLAYQLYQLAAPVPGMQPAGREMFGKAILADGCWSSALGAVWRADDDLRAIFDSSFEQIAYGTFPWGVLAPIAMIALLHDRHPDRRAAGAITLAWAAGAWIATEAFARKVGFTVYAGFPALAVAVGIWLDAQLARRARGERESSPAGFIILGLFVLIAIVNLGKDMHSFPDRITSLLVGADQIKYPAQARLLFLPAKTWILVIGAIAGIGFAMGMIAWRPESRSSILRKIAAWGLPIAFIGTVLMAAFWSFVWQPRLGPHLSSRTMLETVNALRKPGDQLVIMGDLGHAPAAYAQGVPEIVQNRTQIVQALGREDRVFAIAPQTELCTLHRELGGKPYYVLDDRNVRSLLLSNRLDGAIDRNPLATAIVHAEPENIPHRPAAPVIFDRRLELLGWNIPARAAMGSMVTATIYYKVLQPVGGKWKALMHIDGASGRAGNGDHWPIQDRCATAAWMPGDYIIDTFTFRAGGGAFPSGSYDLWIGFFTGSAPNFRNMPVSQAPPEMRDTHDRVKMTSIILE